MLFFPSTRYFRQRVHLITQSDYIFNRLLNIDRHINRILVDENSTEIDENLPRTHRSRSRGNYTYRIYSVRSNVSPLHSHRLRIIYEEEITDVVYIDLSLLSLVRITT